MNPYRNINIAKGIGIFLVVLGHYVAVGGYVSNGFDLLKEFIYTFHMPLFMFLSGFLFGKTYPFNQPYLPFVKKKASRLLIPYVTITIILFAIKYITGMFVELKYPIEIDSLLYSIFVTPMGGFATFLWYIYTLFIMFLIVPLFKSIKLLLIISSIIYFVPMTEMFCLSLVANHMLFFSLGIWCYQKIKDGLILKNPLIVFIITMISQIVIFVLFREVEIYKIKALILAFFGIISIYSLSLYLSDKRDKYIAYIGGYSSEIYFLHTIFMGVVTVALSLVNISLELKFYIGMLLAVLFGMLFPIVTAKLIDYLNLSLLNKALFGKETKRT